MVRCTKLADIDCCAAAARPAELIRRLPIYLEKR
jgi:hypothetical protein